MLYYSRMSNGKTNFCDCLYFSASALSRVMAKIATEEFTITGLAPSYAFLLMMSNAEPGIQPKEIAQQMRLSPSTVTRLIEKMEQKGFVERKSEGKNTRVYPTQKSSDLDKTIKKAWLNLYYRYSSMLGEEYAKRLTANIYSAFKKLV